MKQHGFTLTELAIVLVIISLLVVGVMQGQNLINSARAKDVITIADDLRTATTLFKQRYNYLPGDLPLPSGEITGVINIGNGDGNIDGTISHDNNSEKGVALAGSETEAIPDQLFKAGLIGKINTDKKVNDVVIPRIMTGYGTVNLVSSAIADGLAPGFVAANPTARNAIVFYNLPCDVASEVDNKLDDGNIATGHAIGTACANNIIQWYAVAL